MARVHWWQEISAAMKWSNSLSFECWTIPCWLVQCTTTRVSRVVVHCTSQHGTIRWSYRKSVRRKAEEELSLECICSQQKGKWIQILLSYDGQLCLRRPPPPPPYTHIQVRAQTRTHKENSKPRRTYTTHTHAHKHLHLRTHMRACAHTLTPLQTQTHRHTHTQSQARTYVSVQGSKVLSVCNTWLFLQATNPTCLPVE